MDLLFSSLRAGLGRLLAMPRRPGGRARKANHGRHEPRCELGSCPPGLLVYSHLLVGGKYLSGAGIRSTVLRRCIGKVCRDVKPKGPNGPGTNGYVS